MSLEWLQQHYSQRKLQNVNRGSSKEVHNSNQLVKLFCTRLQASFWDLNLIKKFSLGTLSKRPEISESGLTATLTYWHSFWIFYLRYPIMTMVKSSKFQALRRYAVECCTKPYATIFMIHSEVKITKNIYSTFSWKREKNDIISTTCMLKPSPEHCTLLSLCSKESEREKKRFLQILSSWNRA